MAQNTVGSLNIFVTASTQQFRTAMAGAGKQLTRFGFATKQASSAVKGLLIGMGSLSTMGGITTMLGAGGISYSMVRFAGSVEQLNQAFHSSLAIMDDVDASMRNKMMKTALNTAAVTRYSATEIAGGYYELVSAGLSAQQSMAAMPYVAKFAQAGMFNLSGATELLTSAQASLGKNSTDAAINLENMKEIGDALVMTNKLSIGTLEQFGVALSRSGGALRVYGKSANEGLAVLSVFADQNIHAEEGATALNIVLRELSNKAAKNTEAFKRMGVAVFDSLGNMRKTWDIVKDLEKVMSGKSDFGKKKILIDLGISEKVVNYILKLLGMSERMEERFREIAINSKGMSEGVAEKQMTDWMRAWNKISADLMAFGEKHVLPLVNALAGKAGKAPVTETAETAWWLGGKAMNVLQANRQFANAMAMGIASAVGPQHLGILMGDAGSEAKQEDYMRAWSTHSQASWEEIKAFFGYAAEVTPEIEKSINDVKEFQKEVDATVTKSAGALRDYFGISFGELKDLGRHGPYARGSTPEEIAAQAARDEENKRLQKAAEKLNQSTQLPIESYAAKMQQFNQMLSGGFITKDVYDRASKTAMESLYSTMGKGLFGRGSNAAVEFGSQEQYKLEAEERGQQMMESYFDRMLQESKKQTEHLSTISTNTSSEEEVGI